MDYFLDFYLVEHLLSWAGLKLKSVHLESKHVWQLFYPIDLFRPNVLTLFNLIILNDAAVFTIPNCIEVFALGHVKEDVWELIIDQFLAVFAFLVFEVNNRL